MGSDYARLETASRRRVGAAQKILNDAGFEAGKVDGLVGVNTREAFTAWQYYQINGKHEVVERAPVDAGFYDASDLPRQRDVGTFYGTPGQQIETRLSLIELPFKLRIDYSLRQKTNKIRVHRKCAPSLEKALIAVHDHYGMDRMKELGIDRYAGAYNKRRMRGGKSWSMHAYGCAIDFYAAPNGLRVSCPQALFCSPEYKAFLDIMDAHNWLPAIRLWGKDAMHFQQARL